MKSLRLSLIALVFLSAVGVVTAQNPLEEADQGDEMDIPEGETEINETEEEEEIEENETEELENTSISLQEAKQKARKLLSETNWTLEEGDLHEEDGYYKFEFVLSNSEREGEAEIRIDSSTGEVIKIEKEVGDEESTENRNSRDRLPNEAAGRAKEVRENNSSNKDSLQKPREKIEELQERIKELKEEIRELKKENRKLRSSSNSEEVKVEVEKENNETEVEMEEGDTEVKAEIKNESKEVEREAELEGERINGTADSSSKRPGFVRNLIGGIFGR